MAKREDNQWYDREVTACFESRGWTLLRIWECELDKKKRETLKEKPKNIFHGCNRFLSKLGGDSTDAGIS